MNYLLKSISHWRLPDTVTSKAATCLEKVFYFHDSVKLIGSADSMDDYEKRKLSVFNQLNFFQLLTGFLVPLAGLFNNKQYPQWAFLVASLPALVSLVVLSLNAARRYNTALIVYFICYPIVNSIVYMSGIDTGAELFFILYGILSVFFIQRISHMLFSVSLSMVSYFMLALVLKNHRYQLESTNMGLYFFHQFAGIVFIFYGLFLIKRENSLYQLSIAEKASQLEKQTKELTELNGVKNKLFSVIAHDLKLPMYALRNLFNGIQQQKLPAKEIKAMMPDVINNLDYTTGLMENLLQWAKSQMQSESVKVQLVEPEKIIAGIVNLLRLPAETKQLKVEIIKAGPISCMADKNMLEVVLRNLLSNAIKFTPQNGRIRIGAEKSEGQAKFFVMDNGRGIPSEGLDNINTNRYFTTNGTAHEPGTGLGLMLCRDFLQKNNSCLHVESEPGKGSLFSFLLPTG